MSEKTCNNCGGKGWVTPSIKMYPGDRVPCSACAAPNPLPSSSASQSVEQARALVMTHWFAAEDTPTADMEDALDALIAAVESSAYQRGKEHGTQDGAGLIHQPIPDMAGTEPRSSEKSLSDQLTGLACYAAEGPPSPMVTDMINLMFSAAAAIEALEEDAGRWRRQEQWTYDVATGKKTLLGSELPAGLRQLIADLARIHDRKHRTLNGSSFNLMGRDRVTIDAAIAMLGSAPVPLSEALGSAGRSAAPSPHSQSTNGAPPQEPA